MFCVDVSDVRTSLLTICIDLGIGCRKSGDVWKVYSTDLELIKKFMLKYWGEYDFTKVYNM